MEEFYGLESQFSFSVSSSTKQNLDFVLSQLGGIEQAVNNLSQTLDQRSLGNQISQQMGDVRSSTRRANSTFDQMGDSLKAAQKRLDPLKKEFRALRKEVALVSFGEIGDERTFRRATTEVRRYVRELNNLESQVEGNTAADREFIATLKQQQRILNTKIDMQREQRSAAKAQTRKGEFEFLHNTGKKIFNDQIIDKGKSAVDLYANFDDTMSAVQAITTASDEQEARLRRRAEVLGAKTRFTSQEAAKAETYLGMAGFKTDAILSGLGSTLNLASAGQLDLAESADISSNVLSGFMLEVEELGHATDVLARTATSANTNVQQLGTAMSYAAPSAKLYSGSLEETAALIGVMSNAGVQADKAGTASRAAFLKLAAPTKGGQAALNQLGISLTDTHGNMRDVIDVMNELNAKLQIDPNALKSLQAVGDNLEDIDQVSQSQQIRALKDIFGTTAISGIAAALGQINELNRLSLANLGSSSSTEQLIQYFQQTQGLKLNEGEDIFSAIARIAPDYSTAAQMIKQANLALMQVNLQTLSKSQVSQLKEYLNVETSEDLLTAIIQKSPNAEQGIAQVNSAMEFLGIEFKEKTSAAKIMATVMEDNLAGSFRALDSALEAINLSLISPLAPAIRAIADSITQLSLFIANLPQPIRLAISYTAVLTVGLGALATAVGAAGMTLFGFQQALSVANLASTSMAASLIPLTGFFETAQKSFSGTNSLESFLRNNRTLLGDFETAATSTFAETTLGLRSLGRQAVRANRAIWLLSRSLLLSPFSLFIGSVIILNALIEQVIPGVNLLGITLGAIAAPFGFVFGLIKGITKAFLDFLGISTSGTFKAIAPIFTSIGNAIQMAARSFDLFSQKGEELGQSIGNAIIAPFIFAGTTITNIWNSTIGRLREILRPLADFAQVIGQLLISFLAENSPGPTFQIREKWGMTVEYLQGLFSKLVGAATLVNQAFIGIGNVSEDQKAFARQEIFQNTVLTIASLVKQLGKLASVLTWIQTLEQEVTAGAIENIDLLGFTLLTLASLPMTLIGQLRKEAKFIVPELRYLIDSGIPKSIAYALPGLIAIAISNGTLQGFEQGFADFLDKLPARAVKLAHAFYLLFDDNLKAVINEALSTGVTEFIRGLPKVFPNAQKFAFKFDFDASFLNFESRLQSSLEGIVSYLKQVGDVANEIGNNLKAALEPILSFQIGSIYPVLDFAPPLIPLITTILPMEKAIVELAKSPSVKGLISFFVGTVLPTAFQTIYAIANLVLFVFNALVTIPVIAIFQELSKNWVSLVTLVQKYAPTIINIVKTQIAGAFYTVVNAIAMLLARIPYIGEVLATTFIAGINFLVAIAPRYVQLLLRFFPIKQLLGLIAPYRKLVLQIAQGILYAFREGLAPFTKILLKLLDPTAAFKLLQLYFKTGGFRQLINPKWFGVFYINPFDVLFGGIPGFSQGMTIGAKIISKTVWPGLIDTMFPANIFTSKVTELMQIFADPLSKARASRFGLMVPITDVLEKTPALKVFVELLKGLLLISPIIQIIGRVALTTMFWYSVLKPLNQEMLDAIANAEFLGMSLAPVAAMLGAFRFVVVDGSDALIIFGKQLVATARLIQTTFDQLSQIISFAVHEVVGISSILTNLFKATIGNLLTLIAIGITAALDATLIALQAVFKLMRLKTEQYGDAIVALLHGNIVPLIVQIANDIGGVIAFAFQQTVVRVVKFAWSLVATVGKIGKAIFDEIIRFILDPIGEILRLVHYLETQFVRIYGVVETFDKQLGLDRIIKFAIEYWLQLGAIADVILFITGVINPLQFAMTGLVALAVFLVQEYQQGFKRLDAIIQALQHPIDFLTSSLKAMVGFLGVYIPPDLTEFIANLTEQFVKNIPVITAGIFLIALVIKRNIGEAFGVVVNGIVGIVTTVRDAIQSIVLLGEKIKDIATSPSVQLFVGERSHKIRSRGTIGGFENPFSYSKDPVQQERAKFLAEQRIAKVKGAVNFQKLFEKEAKKYEKYQVNKWVKQAKSKDVQERNAVLGGKLSRDDGFTYNAQPLLQEKKNRFGMKSYELTDLGRSRMMRNIADARTGDVWNNKFVRNRVADDSGLNLAYRQYDGLQGAPDDLLKKLIRPGSDLVPKIIDAFDQAMRNLHVKEFQVDQLLVTRFAFPPSMIKDNPYSPEAFDAQVAAFKGKKGLNNAAETKLKAATSMSALNTALDDAYRQRKAGSITDVGQFQDYLRNGPQGTGGVLKSAIDAGLMNTAASPGTGVAYGGQDFRDASMKIMSAMRGDEADFAKAKQEFMLELAKIQTTAMMATVPDFNQFEESNRKAYNQAQELIEGLPPVKTGLNAIQDGVKRLSEQMVASVEEAQGVKKNLFTALFGFTGVPQLIEQFNENRNLNRRIQETERRTNTLVAASKAEAAKARQMRERGLSNLMSNAGYSYLEEASREAFYASRQINKYQQAFVEQFVANKNFKIDVAKNSAFESDVKEIVDLFRDISKFDPLRIDSIEQVIKIRNQVFSKLSESAQDDLKRLLKYGTIANDKVNGVKTDAVKSLLNEINAKFANPKVKDALGIQNLPNIVLSNADLLSLGDSRGNISQGILQQILSSGNTEIDLTAPARKNVLLGVEEAEDKGLNYRAIEKALGLGGNQPSLRQIKDVGLKNPFAQLQAIARDYVDGLVENVQNLDTAINRKIDQLESGLSNSFLGPTLAEKIVSPIRGFYQSFTATVSETYKEQSKNLKFYYLRMRNAFLNLDAVSRFNKVRSEYKESRTNSLAGITSLGKKYKLVEDPQGNVDVGGKKYRNIGRPSSRVEFQSRFLRDLQDEKKDAKLGRTDANKALLAVLGGSQSQNSVRKMLARQGLTEDAINQAIASVGNKAKYTVAEIMKIQGLNVDKVGKVLAETLTLDEKVVKGKILNNDKFTASVGAPIQWLFLKQFAPLLGDTIRDATKLTFGGIGKLLSPVVSTVAKDVSLNFGELALRNLSTKIGGVGRIINASVFNFGSGIERLIGKNFLSDALHGFANFVGSQSKELTRFFDDQARLVSSERQKTVTSKIISATQAIFTAISSKLEEARMAIGREQGILPKLMAVFRGVRNFFANLLPKGQSTSGSNLLREEYDRLKQQRANAQRNIDNAPDRFARSQAQIGLDNAERRMREIGEQTFIPEQTFKKFGNKVLGGFNNFFSEFADKLAQKSAKVGDREISVSSRRVVDTTGRNPFDATGYGESPGEFTSEGNYRSRMLALRDGVLSFSDYVTPKINETFANILGQGQKAATGIANYFRGAAERSQTAWENAEKALEGKNWPRWLKAAYKVGHALVETLNHGAADVTAEAWERTKQSATKNMNQMAESAQATGKKISHSFVSYLGGSFGNVGKAGMAIGGALTAVGFAAQTVTFSLSNMGFISEETSQELNKFFEIFTLLSTVGGLAAPIFGAITSSLGAIGSIAATVATGVTGIGSAIAGIVGLGEVVFAPFLLGIASVVAAVGLLYFAIKNNFLGIGNLAQSLGNALTVPIHWIEAAWQGFVDRFGSRLMPIIQPALNVAQGLINALNHSPTERIPVAWEGMKERIAAVFSWMWETAKNIGGAIVGFLASPLKLLFPGKKTEQKPAPQTTPSQFIDQKIASVKNSQPVQSAQKVLAEGINKLVTSLQPIFQALGKNFTILGNKIDIQSELLERQIRMHQFHLAQSAFRAVSNRDRNQRWYGAISKNQRVQDAKQKLSSYPLMQTLQANPIGKKLGKLGNVVNMFLGISGGSLLPIITGISGIITALGVMMYVFESDFLGIRTIAENTVGHLIKAWQGFVDWFVNMPLVSTALNIATGLINALNHSPTEVIPASWQGATENIVGMLQGLLGVAQSVGGAITSFFAPVGNAIAGFFSPLQKLFAPKRQSQVEAIPATQAVQQVVEEPKSNKETSNFALFTFYDKTVGYLFSLVTKVGFLITGIALFKEQAAKDAAKIIKTISEKDISKNKGLNPLITDPLMFALIGKSISIGIGGVKLTKVLMSFKQLVQEMTKPLSQIAKKLDPLIKQMGLNVKSKARDKSQGLAKSSINVASEFGKKLRPLMPYLPLIGLVNEELSAASFTLIGLSYATDEFATKLLLFKKLMPLIGGLSASFGIFFLFLEAATKQTNILGTVIGAVAFVFKVFVGIYKGFIQGITEVGNPFKDYYDDMMATINRLAKAGEDFGTNIGYYLATKPLTFIANAWQGFVDWFVNMPLVSSALNIAQGLINALNHNPTVVIPASWQGATERISGMMSGLVGVAQSVGSAVTGFLSPIGNFFSGKARAVQNTFTDTKNKVVETKDAAVDTVKTSYSLFVQSANNISIMTGLMDQLVRYADFLQYLLKGILVTNLDIARDQQVVANNIVNFIRKFPDPKPNSKPIPDPVPLAKTSANTNINYRQKQKQIDDKAEAEVGNKFLSSITFGLMGKGEKEKRLDAIGTDLGQVEPPKSYAWFRGDARYQAEVQRQINEQERLIADQIIKGSQSDSLYTKSKYQNLVTTVGEGENQRTVLNQAGQIEIQKKLAKMAVSQSGVFSAENLQSIAQSKGFKPKDGNLLSSALKYQDAISATADTLRSENADTPEVTQLKLLVGIGNQLFGELQIATFILKRSLTYLQFIGNLLKPKQAIPETITGGEPIPVKSQKKDGGNFFSHLLNSWSTSRVSQKAETKTIKALKGANTDLIEGAIATDKAWDKTTASIDQNIGTLVSEAPDQGYELQKSVSEGSPGPTFWIREHWQKTTNAISGWLNQLTAKAKDAGDSMNSSLVQAKVPEIDLSSIAASYTALGDTLQNTKRGVVGNVAAFYKEIQDKYDSLKNSDSIDIGQLFLPGIQQVGRSLSILGGDVVDFAKRATTSLLTLNFGELADAVHDFGGNFMYAIKGIATGFHGLSLSAIAFGLVSLTSISPVVLIMGGLLFIVAAVVSNFLGARTIIKGLGKVGFGVAQMLIVGFLGVRDMVRAVGQIIHGIIQGVTTGDFSDLRLGVINLARAFYQTFEGLAHALGTIFGGVKQVLSGVVEGIEQIFAPLGQKLRQFGEFVDNTFSGLFQALGAFREGEVAGERFAEVLIAAIYRINEFIGSIPTAIIAAFKSGFNQARTVIAEFINNAVNQIKEFKISFKDGISLPSLPNLFAGFRQQSDTEVDIILSRIATIPSHIHAAIAEVSPDLAKDLESWGKFFTGFIRRIEQEIPPEMLLPLKEGIANVTTQAQKYLDKFVPYAKNKFDQIWQSLKADSVGTILKLTQDATNKFTQFVSSLTGKWQTLSEFIRSGNLLSGVFDELKGVGVRFIDFINEVEGGWRKLAKYIPGLPLFPEVFAELRNLGMAWMLQVNTLQGEWMNFTQRIANSPFLDNAIAGIIAFSQKFSSSLGALRNVQSFNDFSLLVVEQIDKAEVAWKRFVDWLNTSQLMPNILAEFKKAGSAFTVFTHGLGQKWDELRVKFANFEVLSGFFASLKQGAASVSDFFEKLQTKFSESDAKIPGMNFVQEGITQIWYLSQRFGEFVEFAEQKWHQLSAFLANTELIPGAIAAVEFLGKVFTNTIGLIQDQWKPFTQFLNSTDWFTQGFNDLKRMALGIPAIADQIKAVFSDIPGSINTAVEWIRGKWEGFVTQFKTILGPIVDFALTVAQGLINALNHSPTIVIPESWRKAIDNITGFIASLVDFAKGVASKLIDIFTQSSDIIRNTWQKISPNFLEVTEVMAANAKEVASIIALLFYEASGRIIIAWENIQSVVSQVAQKVQAFTQDVQVQEQMMQALTTSTKVLGQIFDATFTAITNTLKLALPFAQGLLSILQDLGTLGVGAVKLLFTPLAGLMKILWRIGSVTTGFVVGFTSGFTSQIQPALQAMLPHLGRLLKVVSRIAPIFVAIAATATGITHLGSVIGTLLAYISSLGGAMTPLQTVFVAIGTAVAGAATHFYTIIGSFKEAKDVGEAMGQAIGKAVAWVIDQIKEVIAITAEMGDKLTYPLKFVDEKWKKTGETIGNVWNKVFGRFKSNATATEDAWQQTTESIENHLGELAAEASQQGYKIQKAVSEGSPGPTYWIRKMWGKTSSFVQQEIAEIAQAAKLGGERIQDSMSQKLLPGQSFMSQKLLPAGIDAQSTRDLEEYREERERVAGQIQSENVQMQQLGQAGRSVMLSLGSALSNFAPQLATPLFMLNDFIDAFISLKEAVPALKSVFLANTAIAASEATKANAAGGSAIVLVSGANAAGASAAANAGVIGGANSYIATSYAILGNAAQFAYSKIILPLVPFLPMILGIAGGIFLLYQAFKNNFLGIADAVKGVAYVFREFFGQLFSGAWHIVASVFKTLETELFNIFKAIKQVAAIIIQPFIPIFELLGIKGNSGRGGLLGSAIAVIVNIILIPLRLVAGVINGIIKLVSAFIQTLIKVGGAIINTILLPIRIVEAIVFGVFKGVQDAARMFNRALDMLLLKPAFIAYDVFLQVSQGIIRIGWTITNFVFAPFQAVYQLLSRIIQPAVEGLLRLFGAFSAIGAVILLAISPAIAIVSFSFLVKTISGIIGSIKLMWEATFATISEKITNFTTQAKTNSVELIANLATNPVETVKKAWFDTLDEIQTKMRQMNSTAQLTGVEMAAQLTGTSQPKLLPGASDVKKQAALPPGVQNPIKQAPSSAANPHLQVLGLTNMPTTEKELKAAYRQQAKMAHPDAGGSAEKFQAVNEAYESLKVQMSQGTAPDAAPQKSPEKQIDGMVNRIMPKLRQLGGTTSSTFASMGNAIANFAPQLAAPFYIISDTINALFDLIDFLPSLKAFFAAKKVATTADAATTTAANLAISGSELAVAASSQTAALTQVTGSVEASAASATQAGIVGSANTFMASTYAFLGSAAKAAYTSLIVPLIPFIPLILGVVAAVGVLYLAVKNNFLGIGDLFSAIWGAISGVFKIISTVFSTVIGTVIAILSTAGKIIMAALIVPFLLLVPILKTVAQALGIIAVLVAGFIVAVSGFAAITSAIAFLTPIVTSIVGVITAIVSLVTFVAPIIGGVIAGLVTTSIPALVAAISPFIPIILGIIAAAYLIKTVFTFVIGVITGFIQGASAIVSGVFGTLMTEINSIWLTIQEVGKSIVEPFQPLMDLFAGNSGFNLMGSLVGITIRALILPLQIVASVLTGIIKTLGFIVKIFVNLGGFIVSVLLLPIRGIMLILNLIKNIFDAIGSALASVGQNITNFLLAPFKLLWGMIQNISNAVSGFLTNVPIIGMFFKPSKGEERAKYASGGLVKGAGQSTSTSDKIPAYLSHGEFVVNAKATSDNLRLLQAINEGKIPTFTPSPAKSPSLDLPKISDLESSVGNNGQAVVIENVNFTMNVTLEVENGVDAGESFKNFIEDPRFENAVRQALRNAIERVK